MKENVSFFQVGEQMNFPNNIEGISGRYKTLKAPAIKKVKGSRDAFTKLNWIVCMIVLWGCLVESIVDSTICSYYGNSTNEFLF